VSAVYVVEFISAKPLRSRGAGFSCHSGATRSGEPESRCEAGSGFRARSLHSRPGMTKNVCLRHAFSVLAARLRPRFEEYPLEQREGDGAPGGATSPYGHAPFGRGAWRLPARRPAFSFGTGPRSLGYGFLKPASCVLPRSGPSARGSESGAARARGLLATPAGAGPIHTSRRNRFASLMGSDTAE
jgi:hypothetical protein